MRGPGPPARRVRRNRIARIPSISRRPAAGPRVPPRGYNGPMRLPIPRVRVRTLLIAVALAAIPLAIWHRWRYCLDRAAYHGGFHMYQSSGPKPELFDRDVMRRYHLRRSEEFEEAAWRPWLPVPVDPPGPE